MATLRNQLRVAALLAPLLSACATTPQWDSRFGESVRRTLAAQTVQAADPAGVANPNPVAGIDGRAARAAQEQYERSFAQPQAQSAASTSLMGSAK
jgi:2-hydroxychromene-2-carboxylate isomerase